MWRWTIQGIAGPSRRAAVDRFCEEVHEWEKSVEARVRAAGGGTSSFFAPSSSLLSETNRRNQAADESASHRSEHMDGLTVRSNASSDGCACIPIPGEVGRFLTSLDVDVNEV